MTTPCCICGDQVEAGGDGVCYGCVLDSFLPRDYERREGYVFVAAYGHSNATRSPKTGRVILDCPSGLRTSAMTRIGHAPR